MTSKKFSKLFGESVRNPATNELTQFHMDMAASIQEVIEIILLKITRALRKQYKIPNLCLAGGVALNCMANSKILNDLDNFENIWIQPAAGDAGGALGAALYAWHSELQQPRIAPSYDSMSGAYLGPAYINSDIRKRLIASGAIFSKYSEEQLLDITTAGLLSGKVIGWFQGRMEYGPRALGNRSILGDPRSSAMQRVLNKKIKYRESFRPFAPAVLKEELEEWFSMKIDSPYMLFCANLNNDKVMPEFYIKNNQTGFDQLNNVRSVVPAITHVNLSARIQTVHKETNPLFHALITDFKNKTDCPMLINTSFNIRGEPIVCSPEEAFNCFMGTEMDMLVIGNLILNKENQNIKTFTNYRDDYEND